MKLTNGYGQKLSLHGVALYYRNINNDGMCTNIRACQIDKPLKIYVIYFIKPLRCLSIVILRSKQKKLVSSARTSNDQNFVGGEPDVFCGDSSSR